MRTPKARPRFRGRRYLLAAATIVIIAALAWLERVSLLRGAAELWSVSDPIEPADAVAVLGGGLETRPFAAADYYKRGLVQKVLVASLGVKAEIADILPSESVISRIVLVRLGVPEEAIEFFGTNLSSTHEEALALRSWALASHARKIIVPTEYLPSRRVRWVMSHEFVGTGVTVYVPALDDPQYPRDAWWKNEKGLLVFQNEIIKYIYYRLRY